VGVREEWQLVRTWAPRHRRLVSRLALVVLLTLVVDLGMTLLVYRFEHDALGPRVEFQIHTFFDAFFFTTVQLLTVSSQLPNPVTTGGRIVDIVLEIWAVIVVAGSAGAVASFFAEDPRGPTSGPTN
jgi:peptidoglycan/LPS O-acetylase OafA/YrhL